MRWSKYLSQKVGPPGDLTGGLGVCMDLGLFYLEEGRLTDADKLFTRLEEFPEPRSYHLLGQLGRGIVLALKNNPEASKTTCSAKCSCR